MATDTSVEAPGPAPENISLEPSGEATWAERRFGWLALGLCAVYLTLVLGQRGDFWPFSRFAMFSNPGKPWQQAVVRQVSADSRDAPLAEAFERQLPGVPFPIERIGLDQHDLSASARALSGELTAAQQKLLATYFQQASGEHLVLYVARGTLRSSDRSVYVRYRPVARIGPDGVRGVIRSAGAKP